MKIVIKAKPNGLKGEVGDFLVFPADSHHLEADGRMVKISEFPELFRSIAYSHSPSTLSVGVDRATGVLGLIKKSLTPPNGMFYIPSVSIS